MYVIFNWYCAVEMGEKRDEGKNEGTSHLSIRIGPRPESHRELNTPLFFR